ncbi:MAG TPA: short-chain dehydrogenase, partial [Polyangia bacterium]|nr:short-chain dehydrogenase [Polyangia bacterium]
KPRREVWIGWSAVKAIIGQRLIPGALDSYLAKNAWTSQETENLPPGHPPRHDLDNVDATLPGDRGAHGPFGSRARTFTSELAVRRSAPWLAVAAAAVAIAIGWTVRRVS